MMTPTSVSSRLSASPVMPCPRSSISFNITLPRPSTRATPSPISRITPTLRRTAAVFAPAISVSRSWIRLDMMTSGARSARPEARLERGQAALDAAVVDRAADGDPHAADERRILDEFRRERLAVQARDARFEPRPQVGRKRGGARDFGAVRGLVEPHQPLKA